MLIDLFSKRGGAVPCVKAWVLLQIKIRVASLGTQNHLESPVALTDGHTGSEQCPSSGRGLRGAGSSQLPLAVNPHQTSKALLSSYYICPILVQGNSNTLPSDVSPALEVPLAWLGRWDLNHSFIEPKICTERQPCVSAPPGAVGTRVAQPRPQSGMNLSGTQLSRDVTVLGGGRTRRRGSAGPG